ncbi:hypothetical protein UFOVP961_5 [uncultured Caudovirales phage]|uniref:Uncharacterized protein n=1 Tax=uncultured Caudovirales phage TaxID=2100421 RepID=A0A6J5QXQ6_9CAUD|nr:hypothetical protein UFOVP961_5 [uncultured Caudovirales phage]CAB4185455.1 hypothetical protein UFOVP1123_75 [uncultured Caudovirales phage]CAB4193413.1 hypothetical protein UFOVP1239_75 [uncultured Caudovirales phage]CAB4216102.1 hypothetical protein UFOVP1484_79 [uncultured Caudovirales phage]CAB5230742.1 hypothetical protein UFOVP1577_85 [uncultured Caudovirales phage]
MADRYWRGGTGAWTTSATANWSVTDGGPAGASVPTLSDAVYITPNSGTGIITLTGVLVCASLIITATQAITVTSTGVMSVYGEIRVPANITWTADGIITQRGTGGAFTFEPIAPPITWAGVDATYTLGAPLITRLATAVCTIQNGNLALNGYNITCGVFSITSLLAKSIAFGANFIYLAHTTMGATVLVLTDATGFSCSGTGGFSSIMSITRTFTCGTTNASSANVPNLFLTSGAMSITLTTASSFNKIDFTGCTASVNATAVKVNSLTLGTGAQSQLTVTMFGTGTINSAGNATLTSVTINHSGTTTLGSALSLQGTGTLTLTTGILDLAGFTLTTGTFSSTGTGTRSVAFGAANIALAHTTLGTANLSMQDATNFTWTGTGGFTAAMSLTRTFNFGNTAGGLITNAPNLSIISGASVPSFGAGITGSWFNKLDFTGSTCAPSGISGVSINLHVNSLTLASGGNYIIMYVLLMSTGTINSAGNTTLVNITINHTGTTTLAAALTGAGNCTTTLTSGTLDLAGFTLTTGNFSSTGTGTRSITFGTSNIALAHTNASQTVLSMADATNFTWTGTGGFTSAMTVLRTFVFGTTGGTSTNAPNLLLTSSANYVPTITTNSWFNKLDLTSCTAIPAASTTWNVNSLALGTGSVTSTTVNMVGTGTITSGAGRLADLRINHSGITTLTDALTVGASGTGPLTLTSGTLNLAGFSVACGAFTSTNTNTRAIAFGTGSITLNSSPFDMTTATGFTWTGTGGFIASVGTAKTFTFGGTSANAPNLLLNAGAGTGVTAPIITSGSYFNKLDFTGSACTPAISSVNVNSLVLAAGGTFTNLTINMVGTGTITSAGNSTLLKLTINHSGTTTLTDAAAVWYNSTGIVTLTSGTLDLAGFTFTTNVFSSSNTNTRSVIFGSSNIVIQYKNAIALTVLDMAIITGFSYTGTGGITSTMTIDKVFTCGTTGGTSTNAPNLFIISGASIPTLTTDSWFNKLDFTGSTSAPATTSLNLNSLTLASGGTYTGLTPTMVGTGAIISAGKPLPALLLNSTGTTTLASAVTITGNTTITAGTLALVGFTLTTGTVSSTGSATRSITSGDGILVVTGATWNVANSTGWVPSLTTINMTSASAKSFTGAGGSYGTINQGGVGALTIIGSNTFEAMTATTKPSSIIFTAGTTQTINSSTFFSGAVGTLVTLTSATPGSAYTVSKASGIVSSDYLNITDCTTSGGARWYAGTHSVNTARNSGWVFTGVPIYTITGQFLQFF